MPDIFARVIRAMLASSELSGPRLSVRAGLDPGLVGRVLTGKTGWPNPLSLCRLAEAAGWTRDRLAVEIDRQLGFAASKLTHSELDVHYPSDNIAGVELVIERDALKALRKLPPKVRASLTQRLKAIAVDPFAKHANVTALVGTKDAFRLRRGDWRVLYRVDREAATVSVEAIEARGGVYR
jgi:mRNA interferase RelE/StbE